MLRVGDMVGYSNGDGPTGLVLGIWSEWAESMHEDVVQTWVEVLWSDGLIEEHDDEELEKIDVAA